MKKALFFLLAMLALGSPAFAQQRSANLTTQASTCGTPPAASTAYVFVPVNTANGGATITVSGTWSGTVSFFASGDGADTWVALNATPSNSGTAASTTTGNGTWQANVAGYTHVCAAFTTASSGTAVVSLQLSQASARSGGGGGGGGGISGTVSSPFVPFASGPDALSDSAFEFDQSCVDGSGSNSCISTTTSSPTRTVTIGSVISVINTGSPSECFIGGNNAGCSGDLGSAPGPNNPYLIIGANSNGAYLQSTDAMGGNVALLNYNALGELDLGDLGNGGKLTLNDATSGAAILGADGNNVAFTSSAPYLTPIEIGNFFGADAGLVIGDPTFMSGATVSLFNDGMGNASANVADSSGNGCKLQIASALPEVNCTSGSTVVALNIDMAGAPHLELTDAAAATSLLTGVGGDFSNDTGTFLIPSIKSTTGQRFVCVTTTGALVSSTTACVGT